MIRLATPEDIPAILAIYGPYVLNTAYSFEYTVPTEEAFRQRFAAITEKFPWLVWEEDGQVLGYAYGSLPFGRAAYAWCCEVSIYLDPKIHGKGIGKKLYAALETLLFKQGYRVIYSIITSENQHSVDFHAKAGYQFVAELPGCGYKFDKWLGVIWMEKRSNSVENPMAAPTPWCEFVQNDENFLHFLDTVSLS